MLKLYRFINTIVNITLLILWSSVSFALIFPAEQKSAAINEYLAPFLETIENFSTDQRLYSLKKAEFNGHVIGINRWLKKNKRRWQPLIDPSRDLSSLMPMRRSFAKKSGVLKVYGTKPGTLVFSLKHYPDVLVKMDHRETSQIGPQDRNYLEAHQKTQKVQEETIFSSLYLPFETSKQTETEQAAIVFSERIPLFSEQEIDQRILLHKIIEATKDNPSLKKHLKQMYKQMIHYICKVDFDDINYTNLPFAKDGRLAPFDTDSQSAKTGVLNFLRLFFGYKVLKMDEVRDTLEKSCEAQDQNVLQNIERLYEDHQTEDTFYANNERFINEALNFLAEKKASFRDRFEMSSMVQDEASKKYVKIIDRLFLEKRSLPASKSTEFGRRCLHISDISFDAAEKIIARYPAESLQEGLNTVRQILTRVKEFNNLYSAGPIDYKLGSHRDLQSFVCF